MDGQTETSRYLTEFLINNYYSLYNFKSPIIIPLPMAVKDRMKTISLEDFGAHVSRMHADRDKWFEMEYTVSEFFFM